MISEEDDGKDDIDLKDLYDKVLTKNTEKIIENMDYNYFLIHAAQEEFFTRSNIRDIEAMLPSEKGLKIIQIVKNKTAEDFPRFLELLRKCNAYLAKKLKDDADSKINAIKKKKAERKRKVKEEQKKARRSFEDIRKTAQFDGRIIEIEGAWFEETVQNWSERLPEGKTGGVYSSGKYGDVFKYKEDNARALIIRRIHCENSKDVEEHVKHEISWGRLKHFAINPLLAKGEDAAKHIFYLVFPSMESGTLIEAIDKDRKEISLKDADSLHLMLDQKSRLSIMYQIASGLTYMHKAVTNFRGAVSHGGVHSENILLDRKHNARLTNFGTAREEVTLPDGLIKDYKDFGNAELSEFIAYFERTYIGTYKAKSRGTQEGFLMNSDELWDVPERGKLIQKNPFVSTLVLLHAQCKALIHGTSVYRGDELILELLLSQPPKDEDGKWLSNEDMEELMEDHSKHFEAVWREKVRERMQELAEMCVQGNITVATIEDEVIKKSIEKIHRTVLNDGQTWTVDEDRRGYCDICVISPKIEDVDVLKHNKRCKVCVCVACLRNSYLNPIECPHCHKDIKSPIGQEWGAILIAGAGNESQEKEEKMFKDDMNKVYEKITSKYPLIMGINKELVFRINPNQPETSRQQLQSAFKQLCSNDKSRVTSLLVYYSGHYFEEEEGSGGFLLNCEGENDEGEGHREEELLKMYELEQDIHNIQSSGCHRFLIFLDCCNGPKFESSDEAHPIIQVNACRPDQKSVSIDAECSLFTSYLLKGLSGKALEDKCFNERMLALRDGCQLCKHLNPNNNGFISVGVLSEYIDKHVQKYNEKKGLGHMETVLNLSHVNWKDATIAYFIDKQLDFEFELQHESKKEKFQLHQLPETMTDLKEKLLKQCIDKCWLPKINFRDADMLAITASTEAGIQDEFVSMEDVVRAWNENRQLIVSPRPLKNLHLGKVGWFPNDKEGPAEAILELFGQDCVKEYCKMERVKSVRRVTVPLRDDGVKTLRLRLQEASKGQNVEYVCKQLLRIKNNKEIQKKWGDLVICWQPNATGEAPPNFLSVQIKVPKALSPRLGATAVFPQE